ncbi:MAG: hypothetical protein HC887_07025 [Desulfobacteraceae bacterium]|nr:hypothetical protein [Desulfobacteraceae bacterium]
MAHQHRLTRLRPLRFRVLTQNYSYISIPKKGGYYLGRREAADPTEGIRLSSYPVSPSRPSISRDGDFAVFVDSVNDTCFIATDGNSAEYCMGWYNTASVAMSKDSNLFGFVFLDKTGRPANKIAVFDLTNDRPTQDSVQMFNLVAPTFDGTSTNTILQADSMTFTMDNRYIVYDAFNVISMSDGSQIGAWSIYSIDLSSKQTLVVMPPVLGYDIGFPALSQTNDSFVTFDAYDQSVGKSTIYTLNLISGDKKAVTQVSGEWGTPCYAADDKAIIYSNANNAVSTKFSLWHQALADDRMTPSGLRVCIWIMRILFRCIAKAAVQIRIRPPRHRKTRELRQKIAAEDVLSEVCSESGFKDTKDFQDMIILKILMLQKSNSTYFVVFSYIFCNFSV